MDIAGILMVAVFMAVQAAVIAGVAWLEVWLFRGLLSKTAAMSISCAAWIALLIAGYMLLGGENAFKDGYGLIALLCVAAVACTFFMLRR